MNLTIVSPFPPNITGIGQYGFHVSRSLAQSGQSMKIMVLAGAQTSITNTICSPSLAVEYAWRPDQLRAILSIMSALYRSEPDLVWFNLGASIFGRSPLANLLGFFSVSLVRSAGIPTIVTLHELVEQADLKTLGAPGGPLARLGAHLLTSLVVRADVVCLTMHRYVEWFSVHRPEVACVHIPIGAYRPPEILLESENQELLFFTTLAPYKGLEILLEAYRRLLSGCPTLRLTIAGAEHPRFPGYSDSLRRKFSSLPGINWLGQVPEGRVRDLFSQAQVIVLPYLASTGSSSVIYQAAMWGRAMVASDLPETQAVALESDLEIEFFKNRDVDELAQAIQRLLDSPAHRRAQVVHNYTAIQAIRPEDTAHRYIQAFNQALEAHNKPERISVPVTASMETS